MTFVHEVATPPWLSRLHISLVQLTHIVDAVYVDLSCECCRIVWCAADAINVINVPTKIRKTVHKLVC